MLGAAALCVIIGVYPPVLYALLPYPTTYAAYAPVHLLGALVVLGAAAIFFFTIGRRLLEPHDTRLRDVDVIYMAAGRGITAFSGGLQNGFGRVYAGATAAAGGLSGAGTSVMRMENRDVNMNIALFVGTLVIISAVLTLGVMI
jgi:hypothetical protein